ncbi:MAG: insulinase family protein [Clostridia bacterium]
MIKLIHNSKFKTIYFSYNFTFEIIKDKLSKKVLTALLLSKGCKKYKNVNIIEEYLSSLYGSNFDVNIEKVGDLFNIEFKIECVNKKYLPNNIDVLNDCIKFIYEIIYNPNFNDNLFDENMFLNEKNQLINKIDEIKDEKLKYGVIRSEELICKNEPFGIYVYGTKESVEKIENKELYDTYIDLINNSKVSVIISGNLDGYDINEDNINEIFNDKIKNKKLVLNKTNCDDKLEIIEEKCKTSQAVITFGLRLKDMNMNSFAILNVYNSILGGSASSKLFKNFREKESLGYAVRSRYYRFKGIVIIYAGIDYITYEKAKQVITDNINEMKNNISDAELFSAKSTLIADLKEWKDSKVSLAKLEYSNIILDENLSIDSVIKDIENVTIDQVKNIANNLDIKLIYLLGDKDDSKK